MKVERARSLRLGVATIAFVLGGAIACGVTANTVSAQCAPQPPGMTGWWPGNGATTDILNGRNATLESGATYGTGLVGQAFQFDGVDDDASVADAPALDVGAGDFTVDFWAKLAAAGGEEVMVEKWDEGSNSGWTISNRGGLYFAGTNSSIQTSAQIPVGAWTHIALRRSAGSVTLFLNGNQVGATSGTDSFDTSVPLLFGRRRGGQGFFWHGAIDEVHYFVGTALSNAQIQAIHAAGGNGLCSGAVCGDLTVDPGEECDDGNAVNGDGCDDNCTTTRCGNGVVAGSEACDDGNAVDTDACKNDCTDNVCGDGVQNVGVEACDDGNLVDGDGCDADCTVGGPCAPVPGNLTAWWTGDGSGADIEGGYDAALRNGAGFAIGKSQQAFSLDGSNDFVNVADDAALDVGSGDFTVDLWAFFNDTAGEQVLIEKYVETYSDVSTGWSLTKLSNNVVRLAAGGGQSVDSSHLSIPVATWVHFAARRSGATVAVFMNGTKVGEDSIVGDLSSPSSLKFGHRGAPSDTPGSVDTRGFFLNGRIDEVHLVVGRALSDGEIQAIVSAGRSALCAPVPVCGNGLIEAGEPCDDGNLVSGDGCENDCTLSCGNGVTDANEECDDGNAIDDDGCDSNCTVTGCGNGLVAGNETCEDGNTISGDGCDNNCTETACGNGVATAGEACDDGNAVDGDGCESDCTMTPVAAIAVPGGTVGTMAASPQTPIQTTITTPNGGTVSIASSNTPLTPDGVQALVNSLLIQAPPASAAAPLTIAIRIDASVIPPGLDLLHVDLTRDGVLLEDCNGVPGTADPDPCIDSRVVENDGDITITGLTSHASTWGAVARGLFADEQTCVNGISKAGLKINKAQAKANAKCLKGAAGGEIADPQSCLTADSGDKVAAQIDRATAFAADRCVPAPAFGFSDASTLDAAAQQAALGVMSDVFGGNLTGVFATDADGALCQAAALKGAQKLFALSTEVFLACEKAGLAGDSLLFVSGPQLAACFDNVTTNAKLLKSLSKLGKTVAGKCTGALATLLPGACGTARNVAYCIETHVECRACRMLTAFAGISRDCDVFDDGIDNNSCN